MGAGAVVGIGTDIVSVARIAEALERFGERFAQRVLASEEIDVFRASRHPARLLAKRFAAKEAALKALGTGFSQGLGASQIAVVHDALGKPGLALSGAAQARARALGVGESLLTLSDEKDYAVAFVVLLAAA